MKLLITGTPSLSMMTVNGEWFSKHLRDGIAWVRRYIFFSMPVIFICGLSLSNNIVDYAVVSILMTYLTDSWKEQHLPKAAAIVNVQSGLSSIFQIIASCINIVCFGRSSFKLIVISTAVYVVGLMLLWFNAWFLAEKRGPGIFYPAGVLIALMGKAGVDSLLMGFLNYQLARHIELQKGKEELDEEEKLQVLVCTNIWWRFAKLSGSAIALFSLANASWLKAFKICALVMGASSLWFFSGRFTYYPSKRPQDDESSPLSSVFKQMKEVKQLLRILSIYISFLAYGLIMATGSTFFIEQSSNMVVYIGDYNYEVPINFFFVLKSFIRDTVLFIMFLWKGRARQLSANVLGIGAGMVCSVLCCIAAWQVELHRLNLINEDSREPDDPDLIIPMSILWLAPQYSLLGFMEALTGGGLEKFFGSEWDIGSEWVFGSQFSESVLGIGHFVSIPCVFIFRSWFKDTINTSHLDRYFLMLAILSSVSLCIYGCFSYMYMEANRKTTRDTHPVHKIMCRLEGLMI